MPAKQEQRVWDTVKAETFGPRLRKGTLTRVRTPPPPPRPSPFFIFYLYFLNSSSSFFPFFLFFFFFWMPEVALTPSEMSCKYAWLWILWLRLSEVGCSSCFRIHPVACTENKSVTPSMINSFSFLFLFLFSFFSFLSPQNDNKTGLRRDR